MEKLKMIVAVADHGAGEGMARALREMGIGFGLLLQGSGTAKAPWLETLGLVDTRKDVLLLAARESRIPMALKALQAAAGGAKHFFALTISMTSIAGSDAYHFLTEGENEEYGTCL